MKRLNMLLMVAGLLLMVAGFASAYTLDFEDLGTSNPFGGTDPESYQGFSFFGADSYGPKGGDDNSYKWDGTNGSYSICASTFGGITMSSTTAFDLDSFYVTNDGGDGYTIYYSGHDALGNLLYSGSIINAVNSQQYSVDVSSWGNIYQLRVSTGDPNLGNAAHVCLDDITYNPVPIPGAVWLLGSGIIGLAGIRRRMKARG